MGIFSNNALTDAGRLLLAEVQMGAVFTPTKIVMGSGFLPSGTTARTITQVVAPVKTLTINKKQKANDGTVVIGGVYSNAEVTQDFYFRELALFAKAVKSDGSEISEVLYSYGNAGNTADLMPAYTTGTLVERQIDLATYIGNDTEIDLTLASGIYVTFDDIEGINEHIDDKNNPHGVTAEQVGADPKGSAAAVQDSLNTHTANKKNPHGVTAEQVGADPTGSAAAVQSALQPLITALQTAVAGLGADVDALEALTAFPTAADLHAINESKIVQSYSTTLNTPYKAGLTNAAHGLCIVSATGNFKTLVYMATSASRHIYLQSCNNGTWGPWETISVTRTFVNNALYVGPTGSDTTGDGTQEKPFASLIKALSVIPKDLGGQTITINVAAGTYTETNPNINDFFGGTLQIIGDTTTPPTFINRINCDNCKCKLSFKYINAKAPEDWAAFAFSRCINVEVNDCKAIATTSGKGFGIYSSFLSTVYCHNCEINNCNYGVCCAWGDLYVSALTGSGNNYAATATQGGKIGIGTSVPGYTIAQYQTFQGGRIYRDAQINVPKY